MTSQYWYYLFIVLWNAILILIASYSWKGRIHFGLGLADFLIFSLILLMILLIDVFFYLSFNPNSFFYEKSQLIIIICIISLIYIILQMTVLRGPASPWNGQVFF